jgi:hypothetical protein
VAFDKGTPHSRNKIDVINAHSALVNSVFFFNPINFEDQKIKGKTFKENHIKVEIMELYGLRN